MGLIYEGHICAKKGPPLSLSIFGRNLLERFLFLKKLPVWLGNIFTFLSLEEGSLFMLGMKFTKVEREITTIEVKLSHIYNNS